MRLKFYFDFIHNHIKFVSFDLFFSKLREKIDDLINILKLDMAKYSQYNDTDAYILKLNAIQEKVQCLPRRREDLNT